MALTTQIMLTTESSQRIAAFLSTVQESAARISASSKSDYWSDHSSKISARVTDTGIQLSGESGFYIPPLRSGTRSIARKIIRQVRLLYKSACYRIDRILKLSETYAPTTLLPAETAYDLVMSASDANDLAAGNPYMLDPRELKPLFSRSKDFRNWFLSQRYLVTAPIYLSGFHHAVFSRYLPSEAKTYLEIGAGSGNLAALFRNYNKMQVIIVDLPETLAFSVSMLLNAFPEASYSLPHELQAGAIFPSRNFVFLLPDQIDLIPSNSVDLAVNTDSMQEMTHRQIGDYFSLVQRVCKDGALWCNDNRTEKFPLKTGKPVRAYEYPYESRNEVLVHEVSRFTHLTQPDSSIIHVERVRKNVL